MIYDRASPCASCPYRVDAPRKLWHRVEFENLLAHDGNELTGSQYGCHEFRKRDASEHRPCAGWLLDQKRRGIPSLLLRMTLMTKPEAAANFEKLDATGIPLFPSIKAMCRANGVRTPRRKR